LEACLSTFFFLIGENRELFSTGSVSDKGLKWV
jgi:hypothetical protein